MKKTTEQIVAAALAMAGHNQQQLIDLSRLKSHRITPDTELRGMDFLFQLADTPCFARGELVGISGKAKVGKSLIVSQIITLCQSAQVLGMTRRSEQTLSALWYDTEQSDESTKDILQNRIIREIGQENYDPDKMAVYNVRQIDWHNRMALLETAIDLHHPDLVMVDGIRDLTDDINNGVRSQEVVEKLMQLASRYNCCMVCVIHQNKSNDDKSPRGSLGTELMNKVFEMYECTKSPDGVFGFTQTLTRKYDIAYTLNFVIDEQGLPQLAEEKVVKGTGPTRAKKTNKKELNPRYLLAWQDNHPVLNLPLLFADALPQLDMTLSPLELQTKVMELGQLTSYNFYHTQREKALHDGLIMHTCDAAGNPAFCRCAPVQTAPKPEQLNLFDNDPLGELTY